MITKKITMSYFLFQKPILQLPYDYLLASDNSIPIANAQSKMKLINLVNRFAEEQ